MLLRMKTCFKCGEAKPIGEFYKHQMMKDGHLGKCKTCTKSDVSSHRAKNLDRIREYDRERAKLPHRRALGERVNSEYLAAHPVRAAANRKVAYEVRKGRLTSQPCAECGAGKTVAHHDDYRASLDVIWLCQPHHKARHAALDAKGHDYNDN
jgi:hypothetical protein